MSYGACMNKGIATNGTGTLHSGLLAAAYERSDRTLLATNFKGHRYFFKNVSGNTRCFFRSSIGSFMSFKGNHSF